MWVAVFIGVGTTVTVLDGVNACVVVPVRVEVDMKGLELALGIGLGDVIVASASTVPSGCTGVGVGVEVKVGTIPAGSDGVATDSGVGQARGEVTGGCVATMEVGPINADFGGTS